MLNFLNKLFGIRPRIFLTSDLHLGHENIIKYCNRPFDSVHEMNSVLIENWNKTINKNDIVYFLGDLAFSRGNKEKVLCFMNSLNGKKIFIRGNHDRFLKSYHHLILKYKGKSFYLVHNPYDIPSYWKGWAICGHTHNKGQFIDKIKKRINVSTELTEYCPISLDKIMRIIGC